MDYNGTPLGDFMTAHLKWIDDQVIASPGDVYWHHVGLLMLQQRALYDGYMSVARYGVLYRQLHGSARLSGTAVSGCC